MSDTSYKTVKTTDWITDNWDGVLIKIENEVFTGLSYSVPGWKCKHCGGQIGTINEPPRKCFHCGYDSSEQTGKNLVNPENLGNYHKSDLVKSSQLGFEVPEDGKQGEAT